MWLLFFSFSNKIIHECLRTVAFSKYNRSNAEVFPFWTDLVRTSSPVAFEFSLDLCQCLIFHLVSWLIQVHLLVLDMVQHLGPSKLSSEGTECLTLAAISCYRSSQKGKERVRVRLRETSRCFSTNHKNASRITELMLSICSLGTHNEIKALSEEQFAPYKPTVLCINSNSREGGTKDIKWEP